MSAPLTVVSRSMLAIGACVSPEAKRARAVVAPGADIGNRSDEVQLHAGSLMYSRTPCLLPKSECPGPLPQSGLPGTSRRRSDNRSAWQPWLDLLEIALEEPESRVGVGCARTRGSPAGGAAAARRHSRHRWVARSLVRRLREAAGIALAA